MYDESMGFASRLGLKFPLIQAPMAGGFTTVELIGTVCDAKALGSMGAALMKPDDLRQAIRQVKERTNRPFNVNLFVESSPVSPGNLEPFRTLLKKYEGEFFFEIGEPKSPPSYQQQVEVLLQEKVPVFSFTFGVPEKQIIREFQKQGTYVIGTATYPEEIEALEERGVDAVVLQGKEAGGHRGTFIGEAKSHLIPTLDLIKQAKTSIPLIASGGIMDKKGTLAALHAGAAAVQLGTAFLTCFEAGTPPLARKTYLEWRDRKTTLTRVFSGKWARVIENRFVRDLASHDRDIPPYPIPRSMTESLRKAAAAAQTAEFLPLYAGENFGLCKAQTAAEFIESLF